MLESDPFAAQVLAVTGGDVVVVPHDPDARIEWRGGAAAAQPNMRRAAAPWTAVEYRLHTAAGAGPWRLAMHDAHGYHFLRGI